MKTHQPLQITFEKSKRSILSQWLKNVQRYFYPVIQDDKPLKASNTGSMLQFTQQSIKPFHFQINYDLSFLGDVLEGAVVNFCVQLIANTTHSNSQVRLEAVFLVYQLATILDAKLVEPADVVLSYFQNDDSNLEVGVQLLVKKVSKPFSVFAVALATGLEGLYACPESGIRVTCITAMAVLVHENEEVFVHEDQ
ncbi:hypothetical protein ROZALSC1DRAFT_25840, partial [Rozella allomycis CSF55]